MSETLLPSLTSRQARALRAFDTDGEALDSCVWDEGVRPWPTMDNLVKKGYVERVQWWGHDEGYEYRLTEMGREYMGPTRFERERAAREAANVSA